MPKYSILVHKFLIEYKVIVDISKNIVIINNCENEICFTLNPRTGTIIEIPIADPEIENKDICIHKQEIKTKVC